MFEFEDDQVYHMPVFFGGDHFSEMSAKRINDVVGLNFTLSTDQERLEEYLPACFELIKPEVTIAFNQLREIEFMAGGSYSLVQVHLPVRFKGQQDQLEGILPLVIWENKTRPIISGREESGQPKIHADIEELHIFEGKYSTNLSFEGNTFLRLAMANPQSIDQFKPITVHNNVFGWRYIPKVGAPGADLNQPILYPQTMEVNEAWLGQGNVEWTELTREQNENQYRIINALAELPIHEIISVTMVKGALIFDPFGGRVLE